MKKKVTSTDIAHAAGVSQSTVSMILNQKYDVSFAKDTVERVENAAKELGYVPPKRKTRKGTMTLRPPNCGCLDIWAVM